MRRNGASSNKRSAPGRSYYKLKFSPAKNAFSSNNGSTPGTAPQSLQQQQQPQESSPPPATPSASGLPYNGISSSSSSSAAPSFSQQPPTKKQRIDGNNISLKLSFAATPTARTSRYSMLPVVPMVAPVMSVASSQDQSFLRQQQQSKGDSTPEVTAGFCTVNQLTPSQIPASVPASVPSPSPIPSSLAPTVLTRVNSWTDDPDLLPDGDWPEEDAILHSVASKHSHNHHNHHKSNVPTSRMTLQLVSMGPTSGPRSSQAPSSTQPSSTQPYSNSTMNPILNASQTVNNSKQSAMEDLPYTIPSTARQSDEIDILERSDSPDSIMHHDSAAVMPSHESATQTPLPLPLSTPSHSLMSNSLSPMISSTKEIPASTSNAAETSVSGFTLSAVTEGSNENMDEEEEQQQQQQQLNEPSSQTEHDSREEVQNEIAPVVIPPTASSDTSDRSAAIAAAASAPSSNPDAAAANANTNLLAPPSNVAQNSPLPSPASSQPSASQSASSSSQSSASGGGGGGGGVQLPFWPDEFPSLSYLYSDFPEPDSAEQAEEEYQNIARDAPRQDSTNDVEEEAVDLDLLQERRRRELLARRAATIIGTQAPTQVPTQIAATQVLTRDDELEATQVLPQQAVQ